MSSITVDLPTTFSGSLSLPPFHNEPFTDFSRVENADAMKQALVEARGQLGQSYELLIGGHAVRTGKTFASVNPAKPSEVIGVHPEASESEALAAVEAAQVAFASWGRTDVKARVELLLRAADLLRKRHFEFCAWLTLEVGKNWAEADADVGECIDFLEFYAREALKLDAATTPIQYPGEKNMLRYVPLGVGAVIPPWNFPLAIMAGMTCAAIVSGNTVVLKPSPDAPTIAARFVALLMEVGLPAGVVNLVQGGPEVGRAIVEHKQIRFIAFTGSKKVGLEIHERAAKTLPGQRFLRRTILELGGKDSIVVDADADLDDAVAGVVASAFGFSGQKCSACSRAIVADAVYDSFAEKLKAKVEALQSGPPAENFYLGPVINEVARKRVLGYIEVGQKEGQLLTGGEAIKTAEDGYYIAPTVFTEVKPEARLAQEEIFGPVLAVIRAKDFDDALEIANDTEYGLTGAIYTNSAEKLERARREFHVGNLYLNRKCTGAMVGAHPFGGFNMSGTDSKAGGPDYLLLFTQAKSIAEKL
ncbi:L-glutamate gamma-semialdehyde dehydrogenase [Granulicella sp. 5B5]|uniref:L-glutamate gamma-semialdehyde dehydrogenase n=1 Tax=Granulicella sp. 5B5 TaxID=1617967 RepID=UPI0015F56870|nr:L-glutamate gamma-semialdehyde dehydrogenase [Granulicella sp. 5B5]QMV17302.1 L-glutamate gamma-semialdehyde dehydrogenase [Granulicella sp. 5B5]